LLTNEFCEGEVLGKRALLLGDSKLVMDWANDEVQISIIVLEPILERMLEIKALFEEVSFAHVFREFNHKAD
jgi:hypothetical protein